MDTNNSSWIDWDNDNSYPLQWIFESETARWEYQRQHYRVDLAMLGKPFRNLYEERVNSNIRDLPREDREKYLNGKDCVKIAPGSSFVLRKAVNTIANQMASGVDQYEYEVNDPWGIIEPDTSDRLAALCSQDYINNRLEEMSPTFSRDLTKYGMAAVIVKYDQCRERNIVERINPKNCWWDTMYSATGRERFRGYSVMISWAKLKKIIETEKDEINPDIKAPDRSVLDEKGEVVKGLKIGRRKIRTLNGLDIYIQDLNKIANSPNLQAPIKDYTEYDHDLHSCYNLNWYKTLATDAEAKTNSGYNGDDVELTVMYDLDRRIEFKIINRRFVISANHNAFCRKIEFRIYDPISDSFTSRVDDVHLDCPLKFRFCDFETRDQLQYPVSPVMVFLDTHDELCAWRSMRDHVARLLSILRIDTNGADATSLKNAVNIMGVILDDVQGDINSLVFNYDYSSIDSQIEYYEKTIVDGLNAYSQFDALQIMGDRASATEAGNANNAVAEGLSTHQNTIMALYADIARQCIGNRVIYSANTEFPVINQGQSSSVTIQEMALDAIVNVKPKMARKTYERMLAANAISLLGVLPNIGGGISEEGLSVLIEQALYGQVSRKMAATFVKKAGASAAEVANAQLQAQNQAQMLQQNETAFEQNPIPYEVDNAMQTMSPDDIDQVIAGMGGGEAMTMDARMGQDMTGGETLEQGEGVGMELAGMTPELGGMAGNPEFNAEV